MASEFPPVSIGVNTMTVEPTVHTPVHGSPSRTPPGRPAVPHGSVGQPEGSFDVSISGQGSLGENSILVNVPAPPQDATEQGQSFAEVVALMRDANGLGEMKGDHVRSSVLRMPHARKSLILFLMLFLYLPCSGISMRRPMDDSPSA